MSKKNITESLQDKDGRIYRNEVLSASCISDEEKILYSLFDFCRNQFERSQSVIVRPSRNNSNSEAEINNWWQLKMWICSYRDQKGGMECLKSLHSYCIKRKIELPYAGIYFGSCKDEIYNTELFFKNQYRKQWLEDPLNCRMIEAVDHSKVIGDFSIDSPVLGNISPFMLSGGVKTLILMHEMPEKIFNASNCGDNCARWILKIAENTDFVMTFHHIMNFGKKKFQLYIINNNAVVHNMKEYLDQASQYL